jgi:hypothetical protein
MICYISGMDGIQLELYEWLTESSDYVAANLLKVCTIDLRFIDLAFGLHDDSEIVINDVDIHMPLKKYRNMNEFAVPINSIEEAVRELAMSKGVYARNISWMPKVFSNDDIDIYDAFISHASEDKETLVRPLAEQLTKQGFSIWYDEFELKVGDSLRQSIDKGLVKSRFAIVVLSKAFFHKNWPKYELNGLTAMEMDGRKVVLPIWHNTTKSEVLAYSPTLADKVALDSSKVNIIAMADNLAQVLHK